MTKLIVILINIYQKTLSPDHSWLKYRYPYGYCRFNPTCSEYSKQAFVRHGVFKGFALTIYRVIRCNPWNKGGFDPVP